jgi:hypothetical protein
MSSISNNKLCKVLQTVCKNLHVKGLLLPTSRFMFVIPYKDGQPNPGEILPACR